jgi:hypothetical protein
MTTTEEVRNKVQRILSQNWNTRLGSDGEFMVDSGSTSCRITCFEGGNDSTWILLQAPILIDVPLSGDLYEHVATAGNNQYFGKMHIHPNEDASTGWLWYSHTLLGDFLDPEELNQAIALVLFTADSFDDELQPRFGGKRLEET